MRRIIEELRRRQVFHALGLYVGASWILIEAASVLLPAFDAPAWLFRGLIISTFVGFPVVCVLAWFYDISKEGIRREADLSPTTQATLSSRKANFAVIGLLIVALGFSIYLNLSDEPEAPEALEPVSVLIADFENSTGDAIFDGLLEQALAIGIESAPHVTSRDRNSAASVASALQPGVEGLSDSAARLVAVREGIQLVLAGSIAPDGPGYRLKLRGIDPIEGETAFEISSNAGTRDAVLTAVGSLAAESREALGDGSATRGQSAIAETFTAASIEAAAAYMRAVELAFDGREPEAIEQYRLATELDPNLGRAYSGWAATEFNLGRSEQAAALWDTALSLMDTMTERERLRTLGVYYIGVTGNYEQAVSTFAELVEKFPADGAARNNLALAAFMALDFETASTEASRLLEIYADSQLYRSNAALYAMYSGDFETAAADSEALIADDPDYGSAYTPLAVSLLANGDFEGAREAYRRMRSATSSPHREQTALLGLADTAIYTGNFREARGILAEAIQADLAANARNDAAVKQIALAEAHLAGGDSASAAKAAMEALQLSSQIKIKVASALIFVESGDAVSAANIADELSSQLQSQIRAYGLTIRASLSRKSGNLIAAINTLRTALELADLWRVRYELGLAYLEADRFAEAFDELSRCFERRGEATAMFLDDLPSFRYLAELRYWLARAQDGLNMREAAISSYEAYLSLRPEGGVFVEDARSRLQ